LDKTKQNCYGLSIMNPPKCGEYDYIDFLTATPNAYSCTEAEKVQPDQENGPSHDSINRLLHGMPASASSSREEASLFVDGKGVPVVDDSTLDKPYAQKTELVTPHRSGRRHEVVRGINPITPLRSDGDAHIPCDYRIYDKAGDGKTKNDHLSDMLFKARIGGYEPEHVLFDSWRSGLENPKTIDNHGWFRLTRLRPNRLVNPDGAGNIPLSSAAISEGGTEVHLKGYGFVKIFGIDGKKGGAEYRATNDPDMDEPKRVRLSDFSWKIEEHHRGPKQFRGAERCRCGSAKSRRNHIGLSIRTFIGFEVFSLKTGHSWFEAKNRIVGDAVRAYLTNPVYAF
jgi:hypothetical protein